MSTYKVEKYFGHDRGYSCAFRQWGAKSDCRLLHGYSLSFTICLSSSNLTKDNWVYDFGSFDFLKDFFCSHTNFRVIGFCCFLQSDRQRASQFLH